MFQINSSSENLSYILCYIRQSVWRLSTCSCDDCLIIINITLMWLFSSTLHWCDYYHQHYIDVIILINITLMWLFSSTLHWCDYYHRHYIDVIILNIMFCNDIIVEALIYINFWTFQRFDDWNGKPELLLGRLAGPLFFVPAVLHSIFTLFFLPSSTVTVFTLPFRTTECLEQHSWMSSTFPIAILNGTWIFFVVWERWGLEAK